MKTLQVEVTQQDIGDGVSNDPVNNPVALAVGRNFQRLNPGNLYVTAEELVIGDRQYTPGVEMTKWLIRYNQGKRVKPMVLSFEEILP